MEKTKLGSVVPLDAQWCDIGSWNSLWESQNKDEEVLCINPSEKEINIKHLLFEFVNLALPTKRQHKINADGTSNCNQEMLDLISKYTNPTKNMSDPRWDKLKTIK